MSRATFLSICVISSLFAFSSAHSDEVQFTYSGPKGPSNWGKLSSDFSTCSSGKKQSPINIIKDAAVQNNSYKPLVRDYKAGNATLVNHGGYIGVKFEHENGVLSLEGKNYTLKELVWHTPSEHRIDGEHMVAELHLVHKLPSGETAIVAVLYRLGAPDPFLAKIQSKLTELGKDKCSDDEEAQVALGVLDFKLLKKNTRKYYRYNGSLTTPPCTENVAWVILGKVRTISRKQIDALRTPLDKAFTNNARPVQDLNGRKVDLYAELDD